MAYSAQRMAEARTQQQKGESQGGGEKAAAKEPLPTTESNREDGRYEAAYLISNSVSLLGERQAIVAGALSRGETKTYTLDQAEKLVAEHRKAEVDPDEGVA